MPRKIEFFINCEGARGKGGGGDIVISPLYLLWRRWLLLFCGLVCFASLRSAVSTLLCSRVGSLNTSTRTHTAHPPAPPSPGSSFAPDLSEADRIVAVACGGSHSCAASASGALYTWGWGAYGQLGHGGGGVGEGGAAAAPGNEHWPHRVSALEHCAVVSVSCGAHAQAPVPSFSSSPPLELLTKNPPCAFPCSRLFVRPALCLICIFLAFSPPCLEKPSRQRAHGGGDCRGRGVHGTGTETDSLHSARLVSALCPVQP